MTFADKLIKLRKKNGWSQEELAEKIGVSRQSVSKWEGAQATPDWDKMILISNLFAVTIDYLLKDEREKEDDGGEQCKIKDKDENDENNGNCPKQDYRELTSMVAADYLTWRAMVAKRTALGVLLCIVSVIPLLLVSVACEHGLSENAITGIGLTALLLTVAVGVSLFISCDFRHKDFDFLESEEFSLSPDGEQLVREEQQRFSPCYEKINAIAVVLCICSPIPLFVGSGLGCNDVWLIVLVCVLLTVVACATYLFVRVGIRWSSMQRLLKQGDWSPRGKQKSLLRASIGGIYWCIATAVYLFWSFWSNDWKITWLVWPIAGVLYGMVHVVLNYVEEKNLP